MHHLDGGELACARLLVLLRDLVAGLPDGDVVHLTASDPVAPIDLPAWCRMTGHTYLGPVPTPGRPTYRRAVGALAVNVAVRSDPAEWSQSPDAGCLSRYP